METMKRLRGRGVSALTTAAGAIAVGTCVLIILLHVGVRSTADALPVIISNLQGRGFQLVTISKLLQ